MGEASQKDEFKLENVSLEFDRCFDGENVRMDKFVDAYTELIRFFSIMGTIFSFVSSDVHSKLSSLRQHLSSEAGEHYKTVEGMVQYEVANGITVNPKNPAKNRPVQGRFLDFTEHWSS